MILIQTFLGLPPPLIPLVSDSLYLLPRLRRVGLPRLFLRFVLELWTTFRKQHFAGGRRYILDSTQVYIDTDLSGRNQLYITDNTIRDLSVPFEPTSYWRFSYAISIIKLALHRHACVIKTNKIWLRLNQSIAHVWSVYHRSFWRVIWAFRPWLNSKLRLCPESFHRKGTIH